jgi:16S rRNA (cytosine967-C5)-methyltransferase
MAQAKAEDNLTDNGLYTRAVAYDILCDVLVRKNPLDQVLNRHQAFNELEGRERNLARMLVSTVLRRKGQLDDLLRRALDKGQEIQPQNLAVILYIGICQIIFMDIPDHAAVDTSVTLAEKENLSRQKGLVNAVLRRMTTEGKEWVKKQDEVTVNIPHWLLQYWIADYGLTDAAQIAQASLAEAQTDITVKNQDEKNYWSAELRASVLPTGSLRRASGGNITELLGFAEGAWWVQDASAALPVKLLGNVKDKMIVDLCAAPGGKTAQLAAAGAKTVALDRSAKRLKRLKENLSRLRLEENVEVIVGDGAVWQPPDPVDAVLLDAPCTATGTLRRHPDVMHLKSEKDLQQLQALQTRLLDNAAQMIKPGGMLVYSTCSLQKSEGEQQVESFLQRHPEFQRKPVEAVEIGGVEAIITPEGDLRVLPFHLAPSGGMDGFYAARLIRN